MYASRQISPSLDCASIFCITAVSIIQWSIRASSLLFICFMFAYGWCSSNGRRRLFFCFRLMPFIFRRVLDNLDSRSFAKSLQALPFFLKFTSLTLSLLHACTLNIDYTCKLQCITLPRSASFCSIPCFVYMHFSKIKSRHYYLGALTFDWPALMMLIKGRIL